MRNVNVSEITESIKKLSMDANYYLGKDVIAAIDKARGTEESPLGKEILNQILENAEIAQGDKMPLCQDTGLAAIFIELGQDVHVVGGDFEAAVQEGIRQ